MAAQTLPIIDIAGLDGSAQGAARIAEAIRTACTQSGFFYLAGHGVQDDTFAAVVDQARQFFCQPLDDKNRVSLARSKCFRGYEALRAQVLEAGTPADVKEGFYIGRDLPPDDARVIDGWFNHGPNQWPPGMPDFRAVMSAYAETMTALSRKLMRGLALSLDLEAGHFDDFGAESMYILRLLHYPPQPPNPQPNEKGCGTHTDWGCLTLLLQDDAGGLQVETPDGWIEAPPIPGTLVVNIGDMVPRWTNDLYRSTPHRVINRSGRDRYSVPFFFEGNPSHLVTPLIDKRGEAMPARYPPITVMGHLAEMYKRTYGA